MNVVIILQRHEYKMCKNKSVYYYYFFIIIINLFKVDDKKIYKQSIYYNSHKTN